MNRKNLSLTALFVIIILVLYLTNSVLDIWSLVSYALLYFIIIKFVIDLGTQVSIRNLIAIIAILQYLVGASLGYQYDSYTPEIYRMAVSKNTYFSFALPATLVYLLGLYIPLIRNQKEIRLDEESSYYSKGVLLIIVGFLAELLPFLGFVGFLLAGLKYVGTFYLLATSTKLKYFWIALVFGYLFIVKSLALGMFHDFLLWGSFLVMLYFLFNPTTFWKRMTIIGFGFLSIFLFQLVKFEYRDLIAKNSIQENKPALFNEVLKNKIYEYNSWFSKKTTANNVVRLNQGWIVAKVMHNIPANRPYADGKTIEESIKASLLPRFIAPNKAISGGRLNMKRYAGINLNKNTSMDIGQIGEAYANYGVGGGIVFMFILGFFFNLVLTFISRKSIKIQELIFWLPLIFLQVVKAETSLLTILNHLAKASLLTWIFFTPFGNYFIEKGMRIVNSFLRR